MKSLILFLTTAFAYFSTVQAYFYVPSFSNVLPFKGGMAYARKDKSLYLFGGENATTSYTNNLYKLTQTDSSYNWELVPQTNAPDGTMYAQSYVTADGSNMVVMGGMTNATAGKDAPLQIRSYNFASQTWTQPSTNTGNASATSFPLNREFFSLAYDSKNQKSYVFGGAVSGAGKVFNDLQVLDASFKPTALKATPSGRYGHTASIISTGEMVVIGGVIATNTGSGLANMDSVWVYKIDTNEWVVRNVSTTGARFPSTCSDHSAVVTSDDKIIIFGGDNGENQRNRQFLNTVAILDTKTWAWTIPSIGGIPPSRRSFAAAGLLDDKHLTVAFGAGSNVYYNDINVFDLSGSSWLQSFDQNSHSSDGTVSKGLIAGVTVAGVVLLIIILFLLWKFQSYVRWVVVRVHNDIWKPRTGEPVWAETSRIASQVFFLFIFVMFLYFVIRQAVDSPNIVQRIEYSAAEVDVPDVRFCFDGFPSESNNFGPPGVSCHTDNGYTCTSYVKQLNMSVFQPTFSDNLGAVNCYLFRAPDDFKLTSTSGANNGSRLLFTMFGDQSANYGRVHVSVYPKNMDPNAKVYGYNDGISNYLREFDVLTWQNNERNDLEATNVYTIEPFTYSALSYGIVDHRYLQPVGWNYVGFLPITNSTPEISSTFRQEAPNPTYTSGHADLGIVAIFPNQFATLIDREVKMYTLVNALGFVGGIFGMLVAVQTWLFGFRPRSPWGVVHRWSTGSRKQSLLKGLQQKFKTSDSGIPLVHPVHHRFSVNEFQNLGQETEAQRVSRVEERMQVLELLFKAYYVDDEVFRSLDNAAAIDKNSPNNASQQQFSGVATPGTPGTGNANPFFLSSEKLTPHYQKEDQNGFSHMFNERQSRQGSISSSDAHSQTNKDQDFFISFASKGCWPTSSTQDQQRLLILDSSFNPPTKAHAKLIESSLNAYPNDYFDSILLLFSINNADKALTGASVLERAQMIELLAAQFKQYSIVVGFTHHGRFIDKATSIQAWLSNHTKTTCSRAELYFILGYDTVTRLLDPKYYNGVPVEKALEAFFSTCHLVCADRGGNTKEQEAFWEKVYHKYSPDIFKRIQLDSETCQLSSTLARETIACQGEKVETMLSDNMIDFIKQYKLYYK
ncbi:hypothetical protein BD560DRAFT_367080 [Blakeslea trispora]|nr:hypothetical protein BD560DRAFT_367080 [Blakeslea trispora]